MLLFEAYSKIRRNDYQVKILSCTTGVQISTVYIYEENLYSVGLEIVF